MRSLTLLPLLLALPACGFQVKDAELDQALEWHWAFKDAHPTEARALVKECKKRLTFYPSYTRNGALGLYNCVREKAQERGLA